MDCTNVLKEGGTKTGEVIAEIMKPHMLFDRNSVVDALFFDGGSNVQKAGRILVKEYPTASCFHGAEHVISLFIKDFFGTIFGRMMVDIYSMIHKEFGGAKHQPFAMFIKETARDNGGRKIGLIRVVETRMGGYIYAWSRAYRLRKALVRVVCLSEAKRWKLEDGLVSIICNTKSWELVYILLKCM